ncbi:MAG: bifunctional 4-hydroxy-2-oxoglutarate aldolase/2-dehydro-3-deoxy-phosphogluconate aldolase [candidate division KSB1 bacterium]|nr:bifunctional 4-hydroxy-2-oxoglutarate aldolase/2-dehydro-3-deoxy-phosphogluconate aldolase [candidate division KSB1 bacterium]MDZ7304483.1 bifunctional 4-hydroxy-2-oxoglutarate aldolase/2-dehydro-3-deoxy-phosphogluconate aldolase [candidate division KSB1 bacterium]MDZ7312990.1 bifunctional 4-hydroxy-2-oxoglutarate aldolase/2-dehydro-3-deoxy-phosphogluconate aldolase [candidate division KSB1 bacterium]
MHLVNVPARLHQLGVIPVVSLERAESATALAEALLVGGLPCAEITFRTAAAEPSIRAISSAFPEILVGAGTVLNEEQVERAVAAGAKFIVSPGFSSTVVNLCQEKNIPVFPGICTPTDIMMALEAGLTVLKFFPADAFGGLKTLKALSAPFPNVEFIPTGGISAANLEEYLSFKKVLACGGSWMVKSELLNSGNFAEITRLAEEAVAIKRKVRPE